MIYLDKLEKLNFCKGLKPDHLNRLLLAGMMKEYQTGDRLFYEGQKSPEVYLLLEGEVSLETSMPGQEPMEFQTVGVGELLGWSPLLGLELMTSTARAVRPSRVLALNIARLNTMSAEDPQFAVEILRRTAITLARRLNATRQRVLELQCNPFQAVS
jgi:CRP-like cAMP-binding protein